MYQLQYVPLALPFFLFFVGLFVFLVILIQLHVLQFAYAKLGLSSGAALLVLLASLIGSYFNIPIAEFPEREVRSGQVIEFFGMRYIVPLVTDWPRTVIAIRVDPKSSDHDVRLWHLADIDGQEEHVRY
jgi:uncharacterized membrane protein